MDKPTEANLPKELFPERLKAARALREMNQADLAERSGLPPTSISHFEAGTRKPSFDNLRRLARALEVTTDYLLGRTEQPEMGAAADPLYRDFKNLSKKDRELAKGFLELLAKQKPKRE